MNEFERKMAELKKYQDLQRDIIGYTKELEKWGSIGTAINQKYQEGMGGNGGDSSKPEVSGINLAHLTAQIQSNIDECKVERLHIKNAVEKVRKKRYRDILLYKFINGMSNKDIAELTGTSERNVYKVIKKAVEYVEI